MRTISNLFGILSIVFFAVMLAAMFSDDINISVMIAAMVLGVVCTIAFLITEDKATSNDIKHNF